jgi:phage-related baseplate assembly protein
LGLIYDVEVVEPEEEEVLVDVLEWDLEGFLPEIIEA